ASGLRIGASRPADQRATFARAGPGGGIAGWFGGAPPGATRASVGRLVAKRARVWGSDRTSETNSVGDCGCSRRRRLAIPPGKYLGRPSPPCPVTHNPPPPTLLAH